jgi:hypothetical protein
MALSTRRHAHVTGHLGVSILYIPSSFEEGERISLDLIILGEYERRMLEGAACDVIRNLQTISKTLDAMIAGKKKHAYGQRGTPKLLLRSRTRNHGSRKQSMTIHQLETRS